MNLYYPGRPSIYNSKVLTLMKAEWSLKKLCCFVFGFILESSFIKKYQLIK